MKYFEAIIQTTPSNETINDILSALLAEIGFESFVQEEGSLKAYIQQQLYSKDAFSEILNDFPIPDTKINWEVLEAEDKNWNEVWEKNYFQPIVIGNRCVIHSTFHNDVPQADYDIVINPQMAFGTGHHETTSLLIEALLEEDFTGKRVLDMGCGTAILAIMACMRGAKDCMAIDIDEWCVRNSLENLSLNHINNVDVKLGDASILSSNGKYDVIIANINRNILLADMKSYVACMEPGATLFMSGFYVEDIPAICDEARLYGLHFVHHTEKNNWAAVRFTLESAE